LEDSARAYFIIGNEDEGRNQSINNWEKENNVSWRDQKERL